MLLYIASEILSIVHGTRSIYIYFEAFWVILVYLQVIIHKKNIFLLFHMWNIKSVPEPACYYSNLLYVPFHNWPWMQSSYYSIPKYWKKSCYTSILFSEDIKSEGPNKIIPCGTAWVSLPCSIPPNPCT